MNDRREFITTSLGGVVSLSSMATDAEAAKRLMPFCSPPKAMLMPKPKVVWVVTYPPGISVKDGVETDNFEIAKTLLEALGSEDRITKIAVPKGWKVKKYEEPCA